MAAAPAGQCFVALINPTPKEQQNVVLILRYNPTKVNARVAGNGTIHSAALTVTSALCLLATLYSVLTGKKTTGLGWDIKSEHVCLTLLPWLLQPTHQCPFVGAGPQPVTTFHGGYIQFVQSL